MLAQRDLVAFVPSTDIARSQAFYEGVLGLPVTDVNPYAMVCDAHGTTLRVTAVQELTPHPFTVLGWEVDDLHGAVEEATSAGIRFARYDGLDQDDLGIWTAPDGTGVAWFTDPDDNVLSFSGHPEDNH